MFTAAAALIAFAANSLLCRMALKGGEIDAVSFTAVRLASGAALLWVVGLVRRWPSARDGSWVAALWLTVYAMGFSLAYILLDAGVGALLLFGCVQLTMLTYAQRTRDHMPPMFWLGSVAALSGVVLLVSPGLSEPPPWPAALAIAAAGVAWGGYTIAGRTATDARAATRDNFVRAALLVVPFGLAAVVALSHGLAAWSGRYTGLSFSKRGLALAAISGGITSGLGYVLWYTAVRSMTASRAASLQLAVPVLTAGLAVPLLGERPSLRVALSAALVLGGIGLTIQHTRRDASAR